MSILTRLEPFRELRHELRQMRCFQQAMDRLFGRAMGDVTEPPELAVAYPPMNMWEDENFVYAEAELPGMKLPDLEITVTAANQLTLKGKREPAAPRRSNGTARSAAWARSSEPSTCRSASTPARSRPGWRTVCLPSRWPRAPRPGRGRSP